MCCPPSFLAHEVTSTKTMHEKHVGPIMLKHYVYG